VLFSDETIANYINENFEPAWQSVRPVPMVTIDFGDGNKVQRTLHGNIATWVCLPDGKVLDILPGVYAPTTYLEQVRQFHSLATIAGEVDPSRRTVYLERYHQRQAEALARGGRELQFQRVNRGASILATEQDTRLILRRARSQPASQIEANQAALPNLESPQELANWKELARDTEINETVRRKQIHEKLAGIAPPQPDELTKWLYREVLKSDLDDPHLGLGKLLFPDAEKRADLPRR